MRNASPVGAATGRTFTATLGGVVRSGTVAGFTLDSHDGALPPCKANASIFDLV